ncbi:MAG TPA: hypothetical protein DC038_03610 [Clostridiales bacterium]|nr:hypothetical protein [Clostridiales bacterium]
MGNNEIKTSLIGALAVIYAFLTSIFGVFAPLLIVTVLAMFADLITRIYAAGKRTDEKVELKKVLDGLYKKLGYGMLIALAFLLDKALLILADALGINIVSKIIFTALVLAWLLVRELISNVENLQHAGIEIPEFLNKVLGIAKDKVDSTAGAIVDREAGRNAD